MSSLFGQTSRKGFTPVKLGVLGGGQLGRMLLAPAARFGLQVHVLDPDYQCPCADFCHEFSTGAFDDYDAVLAFGEKVDVLTIEIEHVNVDALAQLETLGVQVAPAASTIRTIQDKGTQKQFFDRIGVPTAEYRLINGAREARQLFEDTGGFVQKLRTGGYDGRGVQIIREACDLERVFDAPCVAESMVDISKELAIIVARNKSGATECFPVVEMVFDPNLNLVDYLVAPAMVSTNVERQAQSISETIADGLSLHGILAVELFLTRTGDLLVNEVAPRPHNSGHHTLEANLTSQYEQHLRAILNLPLGATDALKPAVMFNLIGSDNHFGQPVYVGLTEALETPGVYPYIYGKSTTKPGRKMGHVTVIADSADDAISLSHRLKRQLEVIT